KGHALVALPPGTVAHECQVYEHPYARPVRQDTLQADRAETLPRPASGAELRQTMLRGARSANPGDKGWVTDQYDRYVQGNTVLAQPENSGVIRVDRRTGLGIA